MNFLFDHNLPPSWARALAELSKGHTDHDQVSEVVSLRDKFPVNTPDSTWLSTLSQMGSWTVVSSDSFRKGKVEKEIVRKSGLNIFVLPKVWSSHSHWERTARLIQWWPAIVSTANMLNSVYVEIPWRTSSKLTQIRT